MTRYFFIALMLLSIVGCKPSLPSDVLSEDDMVDVLYDIHKAHALQNMESGSSNLGGAYGIALRASVLKKYGLTEDEWQVSYDYYCDNSHKLYGIYQQLNERVQNEVVALGGKVDGIQGAEADTANVWHEESSFLLMPQNPYNRRTFEIIPDSTFEDGDRITLQYDVQTLFQDGMKDIISHVDVYYSNDSVATQTTHSSFDTNAVLTINNDVDRLHITKIKGYFILGTTLSESQARNGVVPLRIAVIRNVRLLHLRTMPPAPKQNENTSESADSLKKDSLVRNGSPLTQNAKQPNN